MQKMHAQAQAERQQQSMVIQQFMQAIATIAPAAAPPLIGAATASTVTGPPTMESISSAASTATLPAFPSTGLRLSTEGGGHLEGQHNTFVNPNGIPNREEGQSFTHCFGFR